MKTSSEKKNIQHLTSMAANGSSSSGTALHIANKRSKAVTKKKIASMSEQIKAPVRSNRSQSQLLSAAGFQHSDTNNVLKNALAIIVYAQMPYRE